MTRSIPTRHSLRDSGGTRPVMNLRTIGTFLHHIWKCLVIFFFIFSMVIFITFCSSYSKPFEALVSSGVLQPMEAPEKGPDAEGLEDLSDIGNCVIMPDDYNGTVEDFHRLQCNRAASKNNTSRYGKKIWFGYFWDDHDCYIKARDEYNQ